METKHTQVEVFYKPSIHNKLVDTYKVGDTGYIEGFLAIKEMPYAIVSIKNKLFLIPVRCLKLIKQATE